MQRGERERKRIEEAIKQGITLNKYFVSSEKIVEKSRSQKKSDQGMLKIDPFACFIGGEQRQQHLLTRREP